METRNKRQLYLCDPDKNATCKKRSCIHNQGVPDTHRVCYCTTNGEYSKLDQRGEPIKVNVESNMRYSELYKTMIRGDDSCPFWRPKDGGICKGWPREDEHPCPASEDGMGCTLFPNSKADNREAPTCS